MEGRQTLAHDLVDFLDQKARGEHLSLIEGWLEDHRAPGLKSQAVKERALYFKANGIKYSDAELRKWRDDGEGGALLCLQATSKEVEALMEELNYLINVRYKHLVEPEFSKCGCVCGIVQSACCSSIPCSRLLSMLAYNDMR